ncbi:MAG: hypothetical protein JJT77_10970 [Crocinitomicaceae bacterium]|nr:hypothetical protein [Crocinitomicaceae bacterium]
MKLICFLLFFFITFSITWGQRNVIEDRINTPYVSVHYGANIPDGDFAERFGFTSHLGGIIGYKTNFNYIFGLEGNFMFGNQVREPYLLENLKDAQGTITNFGGGPAEILFFLRGFNINGMMGYIFPNSGHNPNSGVIMNLGAGYLWHRIRIESREDDVPQIEGDYLQGYDRLTTGLNTNQFLGYSFMANEGIVNFYAGFYFVQGFTYNRREIFWDRPEFQVPTERRLDLQYGIRLGWLIPVYKRQVRDFYFN